MKIIVKFSPEIIVKSRSVRIFFIKILLKNIRIIIKKIDQSILVVRYWDYIEIQCNHLYQLVCMHLINIPGIHHILLVHRYIFNSLQDIYEKVFLLNCVKLKDSTFCIRVKRHGNHSFTSQDVERFLGEKLCSSIDGVRVNLSNPDNILYLEIKYNYYFIVIKRYQGLGGLPIGTQQKLLSLISGGFDSSVSSHMLIKRGCKVNYCFFNLSGDMENIIEIYKIVYYLWNKFSSSHNVKLISVNFSSVIQEILIKIKNNYMGVILKRMMLRAASLIASRWKISALVTGEVLGQVSSQTLDNLKLIDAVSNHMVLRPLIAYDKEIIINLARNIGTEIFSKNIVEYCAITSKKPTIKAVIKQVLWEENFFDLSILDRAISTAHVINVCDIPKEIKNQRIGGGLIQTITELNCNDIILDIRTEDERVKKPLICTINNFIKVYHVPFYKLIDYFSELDQNKVYLLYCDNGVMSRLQAILLHNKGFSNVKVYRPV